MPPQAINTTRDSAHAASPARARFAAQHAWALIGQQRWHEACDTLEGYDESRFDVGLSARLARNMAALHKHRPAIYQTLMAAGPVAATHQYRLAHSSADKVILEQKNRYGQYVPLTRSADPRASAKATLKSIRGPWRRGEPFVLAGLGCGAFTQLLADRPPRLDAGRQLAIHLVERDPHRVLACLMLHDWSGPEAPICHGRFLWYVGNDALAHFEATLVNDPMLPLPTVTIGKARMRQRIDAVVAEVRRHAFATERGHRRRILTHYQQFACDALTRGTQRRPRVLLVESRHSTDPDHPAHDIADVEDGFSRLGWTTHLLREPTAWHRFTDFALRATLDEFKPDIVFAAGLTRDTHPDVFPDVLPIIHHLPQLGELAQLPTGRRDFALAPRREGPIHVKADHDTDQAPDCVQPFTLDRRIFETPPLTRAPARPEVWANVGRDLACICNASYLPQDLLIELSNEPLLAACGRRLAERYAQGESLPTPGHLAELIDEQAVSLGLDISPNQRRRAIRRLWHPLNDTLYKQQSLQWIARAVDELDLTFALHGNGWDDHPDFARFAARPIQHRAQHDQLLRDSKINLHLAPAFCLNQATLDGLVAGGFYLWREHPTDSLLPQLLDLLPPDAETIDQALSSAGVTRPLLREALQETRKLSEAGTPEDPVAWLQACRRSELVSPDHKQPLPNYDEVAFHDEHSLRSRLQRFIIDQPARHMIAETQRQSVEHRLSYTAGLRRVLKRIGRSLAAETPIARAA